MIPAAAALAQRYEELELPVTIVAGAGDEVVETAKQSKRLSEALPQSHYVEIKGAGHMVHYAAAEKVAEVIRGAAAPPQPR